MKTSEMLRKVYGDSTIRRFKVYEWHWRFKAGLKSIENNEHVG